ncbi:MAG TPA: GxGYxYP domain-containing protein, partial [Chitinophagaceae bacterium]
MNKRYHGFCLFLFALLALTSNVSAQDIPGMAGNWQLIPGKSDSGAFYHTISLHIQEARGRLELVQKWGDHFSFTDSMNLPDNGKVAMIRVDSRIWPYQVFMGVSMIPGSEKKVTAEWLNDKKTLKVDETYPVLVSQGKVEIHGSRVYTLSEDGEKLTMDVQRDSRLPAHLTYVFRRAAVNHAYSMKLSDHWEVDGLLSDNAFLLSLQGIVNDSIPRLYFVYPPDYDYRFTPHMLDFYQDHLGYSFTEISTMKDALEIFKKGVKGYIIWDKSVRSSLNVAFTLAGLEKAVVITQEMIPMMKAAGIKEIADFRGK